MREQEETKSNRSIKAIIFSRFFFFPFIFFYIFVHALCDPTTYLRRYTLQFQNI